jgi:hypothetical protein
MIIEKVEDISILAKDVSIQFPDGVKTCCCVYFAVKAKCEKCGSQQTIETLPQRIDLHIKEMYKKQESEISARYACRECNTESPLGMSAQKRMRQILTAEKVAKLRPKRSPRGALVARTTMMQ